MENHENSKSPNINGHDAEAAWRRVQTYARLAMQEKRQILTLQRGVPNEITGVDETRIRRLSRDNNSPDDQSPDITRGDVQRTWEALQGEQAVHGALAFTAPLMLAAMPDLLERGPGTTIRLKTRSQTASEPTPAAPIGTGRQYWAFMAKPGKYDIRKALEEKATDTWMVKKSAVKQGDWAIIWQAADREGRRGVVAFAQVLSDPITGGDFHSAYWAAGTDLSGDERRVQVRYLAAPNLPMWLTDNVDLLSQLSVARGQGTVFKVTETVWEQVVARAGVTDALPDLLAKQALGTRPYVPPAPPAAAQQRDPFEVDPEKVDRGLRGHIDTQNQLAAFLASQGIAPLSPDTSQVNFDLAWVLNDILYVAEVKSTTPDNEEKQLRLGLGQVLRYRSIIGQHRRAVAVLVPENAPKDASWITLCKELQVLLAHPGNFHCLLENKDSPTLTSGVTGGD